VAASAAFVWFLAGWFVYDFGAFLLGLPRGATPVVALAIAATVWLTLSVTAAERGKFTLRFKTSQPTGR
jgi:hypothetical protein